MSPERVCLGEGGGVANWLWRWKKKPDDSYDIQDKYRDVVHLRHSTWRQKG